MDEARYTTIYICCCIGMYVIIAALWQMAETKLYGFSQTSTIDSLATVALSMGAVDWLFDIATEEDEEE